MGILIDTDDFVGKWQIATDDYSTDHLDDYINTYEKQFLVYLLGAELFGLFQADLVAQVPQAARFVSIFNEFFIDDGSCVFHSEGMKKMLLGMVYYHYVKDNELKQTPSGTFKNNSELATKAPSFNSIVQRWNQSTDTFGTIQWYICDNSTTYPEYNGQLIQHTSGI
jgi:hypothetical protein